VPKSDIQVVNGANTASQLQAAATKIGAGQKVIIVTDAMDAFWVRGTAVHYGLLPQIAPALDSERPFYDQIGTVLSQAGAVAVGRIIGFERATWA
jgi:maltose-binding protein MalE